MKKKRLLSLLLTVLLLVSTLSTVVIAAPTQTEVNTEIQATAQYLAKSYDGKITVNEYYYVFLIASSGIECSSIIAQFKKAVEDNITINGKLMPSSGYEAPELYGSIIMTLKACGIDPQNIAGRNLIEDLQACLSTYNFDYFDENMLYELVYLMSTLQYYVNDIADSSTYIQTVKEKILSYYCPTQYVGYDYLIDKNDPRADEYGYIKDSTDPNAGSDGYVMFSTIIDGTGFYHYGFNADSDAKMISALKVFYSTDNEIKSIVDLLITNMKNLTDANNQVDGYGYGPNSDSTGLVLSAYSIYGDSNAANMYSGLSAFKSQSVPGAYFYSSEVTNPDPVYATKDALEGLLSYSRMLAGKASLYDLSVFDTTTVLNNTTVNISVLNPDSLPKGSNLNFSLIKEVPTAVATSLNKISSSFIALDISLLLNGTYIQPQTPIQFTVDLPEGYTNPAIYYVDESGNYQKISSTVVNGKITFTVTHFSIYAVVNEIVVPKTSDSSPYVLYSTLTLFSIVLFMSLRKKVYTN